MKTLLNPRWLILINQVPVFFLIILGLANYRIIDSQLEPYSIQLWQLFGLALAGFLIIHSAFTWVAIRQQKKLNSWYGAISIIVYTLFLITYYSHAEEILPRAIPRWMVAGEFHAYVGTFLMPTLAHGLLVLMLNWTDPERPQQAGRSFLYALLIPGVLYLFAQIILPLWRGASWPGVERALVILMVFATIAFLFFLIRALYLTASRRTIFFEKKQLLWKIPITILFPILGLALNNGFIGDLSRPGNGIFGDFSAPSFYIIAILNGILLCLPNPENKLYRLPLSLGRAATFAYTLYFFFVFLPFLPLSVIAILALGTGFLMLTPLALFVIHMDQLNKDVIFLKKYYKQKVVYPMLGIAFLILPTIIQVNYAQDRQNLHEALDYVYNPDYQKSYNINKTELSRTLHFLRKHKDRGNGSFFFSNQIPYLSAYYNWMVLDNLTLSDSKINRLDAIFFDAPFFQNSTQVNSSSPFVEMTDIQVESKYDEQAKVWRSWIHLELSNNSEQSFQEFNTVFTLPENSWISDYYLYVGDRKEMGLLTEKRAATWIFNQIRRVNRDPGLLYYLEANKIGFRVFPFADSEVRKTGIEFLHPEPMQLTFEDQTLQLGPPEVVATASAYDVGMATYLNSSFKQTLDTIYRKPYFHFIVDGSAGNSSQVSKYISQIETLLEQYPDLGAQAQVSWTNAYQTDTSIEQGWKDWLRQQTDDGGFFLEQSLRSIFIQHYQAQSQRYPIPVVISADIDKAIFNQSLDELAFTFPETDLFYHLNQNDQFNQHSLLSKPWNAINSVPQIETKHPVLLWEKSTQESFYIKSDPSVGSIVVDQSGPQGTELLQENNAKSLSAAIAQTAHWQKLQLNPNLYEQEWLVQLKANFASGLMSPLSAYIVVENEAQKAMLLKKQAQAMDGNARLDLEEDVNNMSEPGFFLLLGLFLLFLWYKNKSLVATNSH
ncbi:MAG: hypothetical protein Sapg2KO_14940 [Saprospiraceae bacterium]